MVDAMKQRTARGTGTSIHPVYTVVVFKGSLDAGTLTEVRREYFDSEWRARWYARRQVRPATGCHAASVWRGRASDVLETLVVGYESKVRTWVTTAG